MKGNTQAHAIHADLPAVATAPKRAHGGVSTNLIENLRFGDGDLLRDGTGDHHHGRTLKGRYIVRVGWDDVRGWFAEVRIRIFPTEHLC